MKTLFVVMVVLSCVYLVNQEYSLLDKLTDRLSPNKPSIDNTELVMSNVERLRESLALVKAENQALRELLASTSQRYDVQKALEDPEPISSVKVPDSSSVTDLQQRRIALTQIVESMELHSLGLMGE